MKLFALIVALASVVATAKEEDSRHSNKHLLKEVTTSHRSECVCASGIDDHTAENWLHHSKPEHVDPCTKCYTKCLHMKSGMMASDGSYDTDEMVKLGFDRPEVRYCNEMTSKEEDLCVKAYKYNQCLIRLDNKHPKSEEYENAEEDFDLEDLANLDEDDEQEETDVEKSGNNDIDEILQYLEVENDEFHESEDDELKESEDDELKESEDDELKESEDDVEWDELDFDEFNLEE